MPRYLVVDDEEDLRDLVATELELAFGAQVVQAPGGTAALAILRADPAFDAIVCDYTMPAGNGGELFLKLRESPALVKIPFFVVSASAARRRPLSGCGIGAQARQHKVLANR
jgi:two-component system response regulator RpaA